MSADAWHERSVPATTELYLSRAPHRPPQPAPSYVLPYNQSDADDDNGHDDGDGDGEAYRGALLAGLAVSGVFSNVFIASLILSNRKLRGRMANTLLCQLALLGLLQSAALLPVYLATAFSLRWYDTRAACQIQAISTSLLTTATVFTLTALSVDKYRTIATPLHYSTRVTRRRLAVALPLIWLPSLLFASVPSAIIGSSYVYRPALVLCDIYYAAIDSSFTRLTLGLPLLALGFYIPAVVIVFCYSRIFCIARSHRRRITAMLALVTLNFQAPITRGASGSESVPPSRKERKAPKTISVLMGSFFVCYMPHSIVCLLEIVFGLHINYYMVSAFSTIYQAAPCLNIIVYGSMNKSLRHCLGQYARKAYGQYFVLRRLTNRGGTSSRYGNGTRV